LIVRRELQVSRKAAPKGHSKWYVEGRIRRQAGRLIGSASRRSTRKQPKGYSER